MYHGIINVYKEPGYTSHDVVARLRGILKQKKIGHTGTLDPEAKGVLPVCLGVGTRLCDLLTERDKTYRAVMLLGRETDTQDTTGVILKSDEEGALALSVQAVREAAEGFVGLYEQVPPMYSALKVDGKKLCDLARAGKVVERKARPVTIYSIEIEEINLPRVTMTVSCSKGTYIRTLCHDIGKALGCGGCMEALTRTMAAGFSIEDSLKLDEIEALSRAGEVEKYILPVEEALKGYPAMSALPEADALARNGNPLFQKHLASWPGNEEDGGLFRLYTSGGIFLGIYVYQRERRWLKPYKMFLPSQEEGRP